MKTTHFRGVFTLDIDEITKQNPPDKYLNPHEKLEELRENPLLSDLPPRYLDNLLD